MRYFLMLCLALELLGPRSQVALGQAQQRGVDRMPDAATSTSNSQASIPNEPLLSTGHRYALCIGIDHYNPDSGYPVLHCAVADAKSLGAVFASLGYKTVVMTDDGTGINNTGKSDPNLVPTAANIRRALQAFASQAKSPDDELVISYAGHGDVFDKQAAIVPLDYLKVVNNLVTVTSILGPLNDPKCRARSKLLLLDACHSGKGDKGFLLGFADEKSLMVFSACSAGQSSLEDVEIGHGRFTEVLMWGLVGRGFSTSTTRPAGDAAAAQWNGEAYVGGSEFLSATQLSEYVGRIFTQNGWSRQGPGAPGSSDDSAAGQNPHMFGEQDVTIPMIVARRKVSTPAPLTDEDRQTIADTLAKANTAYDRRNWAAMVHHATTVLRIQDGNTDALALRALGNLHATYINQADDDASAALQADPDQAVALQVRGMCAAARNDKPRARSYLKAADQLIQADTARWTMLASGAEATDRTVTLGIVTTDDKEAVDCLTRAAASPDLSPDARGNVAVTIGQKYQKGSGIPQDYPKAMEWYQKGSDEGNSTAMLAAGMLYEDGHGAPQDYTRAMALYTKAAKTGNAAAINRIGYLCEHGLGVPQDYTQAMALYHTAADVGDAPSMNRIGYLYEHGYGVTLDYTQAMSWYLKAADAGNALAMNNIGSLYDNGLGVHQDYAKAMSWYRRAADLGDDHGLGSIGFMYDAGHGVPKDNAQAIIWYQKAADAGNPAAMFNLGRMYEDGRGVRQDYPKAIALQHKAADAGYTGSIDEIGMLYDYGYGVPQDYIQAMANYRKAADAGNKRSMFHIAVLYENGRGVTKDPDQARSWYKKAADLGDDDSKQWLAAHAGK